jgi:hypothetical protein
VSHVSLLHRLRCLELEFSFLVKTFFFHPHKLSLRDKFAVRWNSSSSSAKCFVSATQRKRTTFSFLLAVNCISVTTQAPAVRSFPLANPILVSFRVDPEIETTAESRDVFFSFFLFGGPNR